MDSTIPQGDKVLALIARRFRILGAPYRLRLLQLLESGEKTVSELFNELDGNQPNVSKHLLHYAGIVSRRREGTSVIYGIADFMCIKLCQLVCQSTQEKAREDFELLSDQPVPLRRNNGNPEVRKSLRTRAIQSQ